MSAAPAPKQPETADNVTPIKNTPEEIIRSLKNEIAQLTIDNERLRWKVRCQKEAIRGLNNANINKTRLLQIRDTQVTNLTQKLHDAEATNRVLKAE